MEVSIPLSIKTFVDNIYMYIYIKECLLFFCNLQCVANLKQIVPQRIPIHSTHPTTSFYHRHIYF